MILSRKTLLITLLLCFTAAVIYADKVELIDGVVLNGDVLEETPDYVLFSSSYGKIKISRKKIKKVTITPKVIEKKEEVKVEEKKEEVKVIEKPKVFEKNYEISILAGYGLSGVQADVLNISGYKKPEPLFEPAAINAGFRFAYYFLPSLPAYTSLEFCSRRMSILWDKDTLDKTYKEIYSYSFLNWVVGTRLVIADFLFGGIAFVYGFPLSSSLKTIDDGASSYDGSLKSATTAASVLGNIGMFIEAGLLFKIEKNMSLEFSLRIDGNFNNVYKNDDSLSNVATRKLSPRAYMLMAGFSYAFEK